MDILKNLNVNNIDLNNIDLSQLQVNTKGYENVELPTEHEELIKNVSTMIADAQTSKLLTCDSECRKNEKEKLLYNDYLEAKQNAENAPRVLEETERNFYEFQKGPAAYSKMREEELGKTAAKNANEVADRYIKQLIKTDELYKQYKTQQTYINQLDDASQLYQRNIKDVKKEITIDDNKVAIDNRMNYYTVQREDFLQWVSKLIQGLYYVLAVAYGVVFILLNKKYTDIKLWGTFIAVVLFPRLLSFAFDAIKTKL